MHPQLFQYLAALGFNPDSAMDGWSIKVAQRDGRDCGFVVVRGAEIHMLSTEKTAMSRKNIIEHVAPILEQYGYCTTRVPVSETDHKLRTVLGFKETWRDENFSYWAMTELPFQRKKICQ